MTTINGKVCVANGMNLIIQSDLKPGYLSRDNGSVMGNNDDFHSDNYIATNGATVFTFSSPDYAFKMADNRTLAMYDGDKNFLGWQYITSPTQTLSKSNVAYIRFSMNVMAEGGTSGNSSDWLSNHRYKLEKGITATPLTPAPVDKVFSDGMQVYGRNLAQNTSNEWTEPLPSNGFSGATNERIPIATVLTDGLQVGDTITIRLRYKYNNLVPVTGMEDNVYQAVQGSGDVGGWASGSFPGKVFKFSGTGEETLQWSYVITAEHLKNKTWSVNFRHAYFASGNAQVKEFKVEKGDIATPWTPAPEDVM